MKLLNYSKQLSAGAVCLMLGLALAPSNVLAQAPGGDKGPPGMDASLSKWFANNTNFIAKVDVRVLDKKQQETTSMPMNFEMLGSRVRVEMNWTQVKTKDLSPDFPATMKKMGLDEMTTVLLPDKKLILSIFPGVKSYSESAMPKTEIESAAKDYKVEKSKVGKETIDGHTCDKNNVTLTDDKGAKQSAVVWNATDMKDFPIQIQLTEDESTVIMKFKDVKIGRPDKAHFEAPSGLTKFDSVNALMSDAITKQMNAGAAK